MVLGCSGHLINQLTMNNIGVDRVSTDNVFNFKYKFDNDISEDNSDT